jgi:hypothetical protein
MSFSHGSGLLFLKDSHSKLSFLVDSGAKLSILPCSSSAMASGPKLNGANGANIPTWGFQKRTLAFGNKFFTHEFLLAKVATPILGLDFLRKFQLSIQPLQSKVLDKDQRPLTSPYVAAAATQAPKVKTTPPPQVRRYRQHGPSCTNRGGKEGLLQQHCRRLTGRQHTTAGGKQCHPEPERWLLAKYPSIVRSETLTPHPHMASNTTSIQVAIAPCSHDCGDWH